MPKVTGTKIHEIEGIEIYVTQLPAKRKGRDRIWIQIRQKEDKPWRMVQLWRTRAPQT
jgi:hypothetical protein